MRQRWFKRLVCSTVFAVIAASAIPAMAEKESWARSILLPGSGQAHQGHYTKATIFAGAAIITGTGLKDTETALKGTEAFTELPADITAVERALGWS